MKLSDEFLEKYKNINPRFGGNGMGEFVFWRTYSRWLETQGKRETWAETVRRVVDYSMSLHKTPYPQDQSALESEAQLLFEYIYNLKIFPAGRTLWIGGTEAAKKYPLANFNCSFRVVDSLEAFTEVFYLLMLGCGTGFRVLPSDVEALPHFRNSGKLKIIKGEHENLIAKAGKTITEYDYSANYLIIVGDSKEGWVAALQEYLDSKSQGKDIVIDTVNIRPKGSKLKTFGGRASGPEGLEEMFLNIDTVINNAELDGDYRKLHPIDVLDIMNIIAYNVVVGGVRRSSQIALFDINDKDILNAKTELYTKGSPNYGKWWRAMSNNSIYFTDRPSVAQLRDIFTRISENGEPGFLNAKAGQRRRPNFNGINPCAEILLDNRAVCNLTEINLKAFIKKTDAGYEINDTDLYLAVVFATRMGLRLTNLTLELPEWDKIQKRDRLTGVSISGVMDTFDKLGWDTKKQNELLNKINKLANDTAVSYAKEMRIPTPLLVTTVKPSGTISQLPTVSSGVHRSFAPYFIRRIRITSSDPLAQVVKTMNYPIFPETGMGPNREEFLKLDWGEQQKILSTANTWVIEFPIKTDAETPSADEPAVNQFKRYLQFQENYSDHNTSISIYFSKEEIDDIIRMILLHWDEYIAVSFLPTDSHTYNLMPYEEINEKQYNQRTKDIIKTDSFSELLEFYEKSETDALELDASCATGVCPPR